MGDGGWAGGLAVANYDGICVHALDLRPLDWSLALAVD